MDDRPEGRERRESEGPEPCVLVADDEALMLEIVRDLLAPAGFRVREASDGREALAMARAWHPDVALLDVRMAGLDGQEVCRAIKGDRELSGTVVVLFSGLGEDKVEWRDAGADAFRSKGEAMAELPLFLRRVSSRA